MCNNSIDKLKSKIKSKKKIIFEKRNFNLKINSITFWERFFYFALMIHKFMLIILRFKLVGLFLHFFCMQYFMTHIHKKDKTILESSDKSH